MARSLKFCIKEIEELYYLCSENKGADQLHSNCYSYCAADLRLCFCICKKPVFSQRGSYNNWFNGKTCNYYRVPTGFVFTFQSTK